jgi:hypothetical protein
MTNATGCPIFPPPLVDRVLLKWAWEMCLYAWKHHSSEYMNSPFYAYYFQEIDYLDERGFVVACQSLGQVTRKNHVLVLGQKHPLKRGFDFQMSEGSSRDCCESRRVLDLLDGKKSLPIQIDLESRDDNCILDIRILERI